MKYHFANVINSFSNILDGGDGKIKHFFLLLKLMLVFMGCFACVGWFQPPAGSSLLVFSLFLLFIRYLSLPICLSLSLLIYITSLSLLLPSSSPFTMFSFFFYSPPSLATLIFLNFSAFLKMISALYSCSFVS